MRAVLSKVIPNLIRSPFLAASQPLDAVRPATCTVTTGVPPSICDTRIYQFRFNTIDHIGSVRPQSAGYYSDYSCSQRTVVASGNTYQATMEVGPFVYAYRIYIDYNNDGSFNETTERVMMGGNNLRHSTTYSVRAFVTIPATAVRNAYLRMRVISDTYWYGPITACYLPGYSNLGYGEVKDYGIFIEPDGLPPALALQPLANPFCPNQTIDVPFSTTGSFGADNRFTVQLSDASGSFAQPTSVGSGTANPVQVSMPSTLSLNGTYRLRILSSNPVLMSEESVPLTLELPPTALLRNELKIINRGQVALLYFTFTGKNPWQISLQTTVLADGSSSSQNVIFPNDYLPLGDFPTQSTSYSLVSVSNVCGVGTASGSMTVLIACTTPTGMASSFPKRTEAGLYWNNDESTGFDVQWRPSASTSWRDTTVLSAFLRLTALTPNSHYQWRVRSNCLGNRQSDWTAVQSFTVGCPMVNYYSLLQTSTPTSASLTWGATGDDVSYKVQWRQQGGTTWTVSPPISTTTYALTGLSPTSGYEWQVATVCPEGTQSAFTTPISFSALCTSPTGLSVLAVTSSQARIGWRGLPGQSYQVRWRLYGSSSWTEGSVTANSVYDLTGLTPNRDYQWNVRAICAGTVNSDYYSFDNSFYTSCNNTELTGLLVTNITSVSARIAWNEYLPGLTYQLQVLRVGSSTPILNLTTVSNTFYNLTGLTNQQEYEVSLRLNCSTGASGWSYTMFRASDCPIPQGLFETSVDSHSITLNWLAAPGAIGYRVRWGQAYNTQYDTPLLTTNSYAIENLYSDWPYTWAVYAVCSTSNVSGLSPVRSVRTQSACKSLFSMSDNPWDFIYTWSCRRLPTVTDVVTLRHAVTIRTNQTGNALRLIYAPGGKLIYQPNARLRLGQ